MKRYDFKFDNDEVITVKGKGLKEAIRDYKQQNPKQRVHQSIRKT